MTNISTVLLDWSPENAPVRWIVINAALALGSTVLLIDLIAAYYDPDERAFASAFYLTWNLVLCFLWVVETALETLHHRVTHPNQRLTWELRIFWVLAIYFFVESIEMLWERWPVEEHLVVGIADEVFNMVCYLYMVGRTWYILKHPPTKDPLLDLEEKEIQLPPESSLV